MTSPYRRVLQSPGAVAFSSAALVGRMPLSMIGLGIVLLVSAVTGSYGLAGVLSATFLVAEALLAVPQGRMLDRWGQGSVLTVAVVVNTASLLLLVLAVQLGWPVAIAFVAAALGGASMPALGAAVRTRWSHRVARPADIHTAYALESVLDEVVFIVGPVLVTLLATAWHPTAGLSVAAALGLAGTVAYAAQRRTEPPAHPRGRVDDGSRQPIPWGSMLVIALVALLLGGTFGSAEVTTVAFAEERGVKSWAGVLLALWSFGSLIAGVITGAVHWRSAPGMRLRLAMVVLAVAMAPLPWVSSVPLLGGVLFVAGFAIAPSLISLSSLTQQTVPAPRLSEGMALVHTGIAAGVAPGAALAGAVIDLSGAAAAFLIPVGSAALGAVAALVTPRGAPSQHHGTTPPLA